MKALYKIAMVGCMVVFAGCNGVDSVAGSQVLAPSDSYTATGAVARTFGEMSVSDSALDMIGDADVSMPDIATQSNSALALRFAGRGAVNNTRTFALLSELSDSSKGYITIAVINDGLVLQKDTIRLALTNGVADTTKALWMRGSKSVAGFVTESYSVIPERTGATLKEGRVLAQTHKYAQGGESVHVEILADGGNDQSMDTESDNRVWKLQWVRMQGLDTLVVAKGAALDPTKALKDDSGTTDFVYDLREARLARHPLFSRHWKLVGRVSGTDTIMLSAVSTREWANGRIDSVVTKNLSRPNDPLCLPGDTASVTFSSVRALGADGDSVRSFRSTIRMHLQNGFGKRNAVLGVQSERIYVVGDVASTRFEWNAKTEVPDGQAPIDGSFLYQASYVDGRNGTLAGSFDAGTLSGTWTAPDGSVTVVNHVRN